MPAKDPPPAIDPPPAKLVPADFFDDEATTASHLARTASMGGTALRGAWEAEVPAEAPAAAPSTELAPAHTPGSQSPADGGEAASGGGSTALDAARALPVEAPHVDAAFIDAALVEAAAAAVDAVVIEGSVLEAASSDDAFASMLLSSASSVSNLRIAGSGSVPAAQARGARDVALRDVVSVRNSALSAVRALRLEKESFQRCFESARDAAKVAVDSWKEKHDAMALELKSSQAELKAHCALLDESDAVEVAAKTRVQRISSHADDAAQLITQVQEALGDGASGRRHSVFERRLSEKVDDAALRITQLQEVLCHADDAATPFISTPPETPHFKHAATQAAAAETAAAPRFDGAAAQPAGEGTPQPLAPREASRSVSTIPEALAPALLRQTGASVEQLAHKRPPVTQPRGTAPTKRSPRKVHDPASFAAPDR
ncbi:hypothetical protein M885DRAFT_585740 [Pelagophyceae sp. CCMP2097]|nr:hypothetical protein M885DRAFT_585740 [Pelagophyceae sp. CCMP2097]